MLDATKYRPRFPDSPFIHVADLVDQKTGRTIRETNLEKQHAIPVGTLVEIVPYDDDDRHAGVRLYVVHHHRDCDRDAALCDGVRQDRYSA